MALEVNAAARFPQALDDFGRHILLHSETFFLPGGDM
jgi:hypothetical protein